MDFSVLQCKYFFSPNVSKSNSRTVKDYEMDFFLGEYRELYVDNKKYVVKRGDICFRRPGQRAYGVGNNEAYLLTLDFTRRGRIEKDYSRNSAAEQQPVVACELLDEIPPVFTPHNRERYELLFKALTTQMNYTTDVSKAIVMEILYRINAELKHDYFVQNASASEPVDKIMQYIQRHYAENITLKTLSEIAHLDRSYLVRIFKKKYQCTPIRYLINLRLNNARDLVLETDASIADIADCCGYNDKSFFIAQYKSKFGITPSKHRKNIRQSLR